MGHPLYHHENDGWSYIIKYKDIEAQLNKKNNKDDLSKIKNLEGKKKDLLVEKLMNEEEYVVKRKIMNVDYNSIQYEENDHEDLISNFDDDAELIKKLLDSQVEEEYEDFGIHDDNLQIDYVIANPNGDDLFNEVINMPKWDSSDNIVI